jgi:hypothetical protein
MVAAWCVAECCFVVPPARLERARLATTDFESAASTDSATGACSSNDLTNYLLCNALFVETLVLGAGRHRLWSQSNVSWFAFDRDRLRLSTMMLDCCKTCKVYYPRAGP